MKREFWVEIEKPDKIMITTCIEAGVDAILVKESGVADQIHRLGKINVIAPDGDETLGEDVVVVEINDKGDENKAAKLAANKKVIVDTHNWEIIPLENLLVQADSLYTYVKDADSAKLATKIMEKGVKGVVLRGGDANSVREISTALKEAEENIPLIPITITKVTQVGMGDRVCVDTCTKMKIGEGMLVGNGSSGFFLVHAEVEESEYVASRPFRVNAGAVHAYIKVPDGKTKYLSEVEAGIEVLIVSADGKAQRAIVGRAKVERRPMFLFEGKTEAGETVSLLLQNAETIKLTSIEGKPISVVAVKEGDQVLGFTEEAGRHFGMKVKETIQEK